MGYCALGLLPWWLWGPRAAKMGIKYQYVTQAQLFADRFQSKALSVIIALVSILAFIQYITLQMKGSAYVFEIASGGRIPFWAGALIAYIVVVVYVFFGGVRVKTSRQEKCYTLNNSTDYSLASQQSHSANG